MHHVTPTPHAVNFLIAFCLHNSGQEKENRIWSSFIWNSLSGSFPAWGMCQRIGVWHKPLALGNLGRNQRAVMSQTDLGLLVVAKYKSRTLLYITQRVRHYGKLYGRLYIIMPKYLNKSTNIVLVSCKYICVLKFMCVYVSVYT